MSLNDKVVAVAAAEVGTHESPMGSNRGGCEKYQRLYGEWMVGQPWCAAFAGWVYRRAMLGSWQVVSPSTALTCTRARAAGWSATPAPGALIIWCGTHVGILDSPVGSGLWSTIEGNSGDAVSRRVRSLAGASVLCPPELGAWHQAPPPAVRLYYLEDTAAHPVLYGPWRSQAARDKQLATLPAAERARARKVRTGKGRYAFEVGPRRLYGPWRANADREAARRELEERVGHALRPFSKTIAPPAPGHADGMGKTT